MCLCYVIPMNKSNPIGVRLSLAGKAALEKAAKSDRRSEGGLLRLIVEDWLKSKGWLEAVADADVKKGRAS